MAASTLTLRYPRLDAMVRLVSTRLPEAGYKAQVIPYLVSVWLHHYESTSSSEAVETSTLGFSYLFDLRHERLLAAWGVSKGKHSDPRDKWRMAGHPLSAGAHFHRGHAIPHTLGGGTDINLVPQLGSVNVGPFRALEKRAVATPGALYFTYWMYGRSDSQTPTSVDQGLLLPGTGAEVVTHRN